MCLCEAAVKEGDLLSAVHSDHGLNYADLLFRCCLTADLADQMCLCAFRSDAQTPQTVMFDK